MSGSGGPRGSSPARPRRFWQVGIAAILACGVLAGPASAASFLRGFNEPLFMSADGAARDSIFDQSVRANANLARLNFSWRRMTNGVPANPASPSDPAYNFTDLDEAVREAASRGLQVLITVYEAPEFAEAPNQPSDANPGTWKPDPEALGQLAQAIASRYSGSFTPTLLGQPLPAVRYFEAWNEANISEYLTPQSKKGKLVGADHYREMLNAFSAGVARSSNSGAKVVFAGSAPYGDPIGGRRTRPLRFLREVFCLNGKLKGTKCKDEANFDILGHHPITLSGGPNRSAIHPDDAAMPDFKNVIETLRAAERENTIAGGKHAAWATEIWWETKPPDPNAIPVNKHARWVAESLFSLWKQDSGAVIWLQIIDTPLDPDGSGAYQTGLLNADGSEKRSFTAFRFPFVADRTSKSKVNVWTIAPASGTLEIQEKRRGEFRTIDRMDVRDGKPDQKKIKLNGNAKLRGVIAGEASLADSG